LGEVVLREVRAFNSTHWQGHVLCVYIMACLSYAVVCFKCITDRSPRIMLNVKATITSLL